MAFRSGASGSHTASYDQIDKLRGHRTIQILVSYWIGTVLVGTFLPAGSELQNLLSAAHHVVGRFSGVMQAASRSFDQSYIEVFAAFCLSWSVLLAVAAFVWLPRGSHMIFLNWRSKALLL